MDISQRAIRRFQKDILFWYAQHKRDLPWREIPFDTSLQQRDPYRILVSEIMLQQTQVNRVIPKYEAWLQAFPTVRSLANAKTSEVLRLWSGLGYNRRALYLQKAAQALVEMSSSSLRHSRESGNLWIPDQVGDDKVNWPRTVEELKKLPGIGEYTARAIACFAFDEQIAVVDTNVRKVILKNFLQNHPEFISGSHIKTNETLKQVPGSIPGLKVQHDKISEKVIQTIADQLLPKGRAYEWNYPRCATYSETRRYLYLADFCRRVTGMEIAKQPYATDHASSTGRTDGIPWLRQYQT